MRILVDFPAPPEFLLPGAWGVIHSSCSFFTQIVDSIVCSLLSLRNPYFDLNLRRRTARQFVEKCQFEDVFEVTTIDLGDARSYESTYRLGGFQRVIVTEVRGSFFHGRYFHTQRVLAMIERDLAYGQSGALHDDF